MSSQLDTEYTPHKHILPFDESKEIILEMVTGILIYYIKLILPITYDK